MLRVFSALLILSTAVHVQAGPVSAWAGIWQGTLGKYPVMACLQLDGSGEYFGAYYYEKRLRVITLRSDQEVGAAPGLHFVESEAMPTRNVDAKASRPANKVKASQDTYARWELQHPAGDSLQGRFLGATDASLPIALHRVGAAEDTCSNAAFAGPLHLEYKVDAGKPDGKAAYYAAGLDYGKVADYQVTGFQLNAADPVSTKINLELIKNLRQEGENVVECRSNMLDTNGSNGDYTSATEPALLSSRWLVTRNTESDYCGGAHPDASISYTTWDRATGKHADPWTWLTAAAVKRTPMDTGGPTTYIQNAVQPPLQKLLAKHWPHGEKDCSDLIDNIDNWQAHPGLHGLIFTPILPHVVFACTEDVEIPYAEIRPLLTSSGRAAVKTIEAEPLALEKKW